MSETITGIVSTVDSRPVTLSDGVKNVYSIRLEGDSRRFDTWNPKLAGAPQGAQVEITFDTEQKGQYTNYKIKSVKGLAAPANGTPQANTAPPQPASTGEPTQRDLQIVRQSSAKTAFGFYATELTIGVPTAEVLNDARVLSDELVHYAFTGEWYAGKPEPQGGWKWDGSPTQGTAYDGQQPEEAPVAQIPSPPQQPATADGGIEWPGAA